MEVCKHCNGKQLPVSCEGPRTCNSSSLHGLVCFLAYFPLGAGPEHLIADCFWAVLVTKIVVGHCVCVCFGPIQWHTFCLLLGHERILGNICCWTAGNFFPIWFECSICELCASGLQAILPNWFNGDSRETYAAGLQAISPNGFHRIVWKYMLLDFKHFSPKLWTHRINISCWTSGKLSLVDCVEASQRYTLLHFKQFFRNYVIETSDQYVPPDFWYFFKFCFIDASENMCCRTSDKQSIHTCPCSLVEVSFPVYFGSSSWGSCTLVYFPFAEVSFLVCVCASSCRRVVHVCLFPFAERLSIHYEGC